MDTPAVRTVTTANGGTATVIGVAHLSTASRDAVEKMIKSTRPDVVMLELDAGRARAMGLHKIVPWEEAYPSGGVFPGILPFAWATAASACTLVYAAMFRNVRYGGEQVAAAEAAAEVGAKVQLIDRNISVTLSRLAPQISWSDIWYMLPSIVCGMALKPGYHPPHSTILRMLWHTAAKDYVRLADCLTAIDLDAAAADAQFASSPMGRAFTSLNSMLIAAVRDGSLADAEKRVLPSRFEAAVSSLELREAEWMPSAISTERDAVLASAIQQCHGKRIVAVVGVGHMDGISKFSAVRPTSDVSSLLAPPPFHGVRTVAVPVASAGLLAYGMYRLWKRSRIGAVSAVAASAAVFVSAAISVNAIRAVHSRVVAAIT